MSVIPNEVVTDDSAALLGAIVNAFTSFKNLNECTFKDHFLVCSTTSLIFYLNVSLD